MSKGSSKRHTENNRRSKGQVPRTERPLLEKLEALDDHLFLLRDALHNLQHDDARLKTLSSELRLLICISSGTEGLMWRLTKEMKIDESVFVHLPADVDLTNPLCQGLKFMHMPLSRGGESDPRFPTGQLSFRVLVKECSAVFANGDHITHEKIIGLVANQIGSSHESDKVSHRLQFLRNVFFNNRPSFFDILVRDAEFTLEIGERIISEAEKAYKFTRKARTRYGDLSITARVQLNEVTKTVIHVFSFDSAISKVTIKAELTNKFIICHLTKSGITVTSVEAPLPSEYQPDMSIAFCLSYSSHNELARVIVGDVAGPGVAAPLGFVDIREMKPSHIEVSNVLTTQLVLPHNRFLRVEEVKRLGECGPPYFGGLLKPGDSANPVFP
jgi:hypothetical protein